MKIEKFKDKSKSKRKVLLISFGIIMLISVSLFLYKNNNLKVKNDDVYFAFYNGNEKLESMPQKDNDDNIIFSHGECDNGAKIEWNESEWAPLVKNLSKSKTKCSLYFNQASSYVKEVIKCGRTGSSAVECMNNNANLDEVNLAFDGKESLGDLGTDDNNLRYIGANPDNYVTFNGEIWRIIGIIDGKLKLMKSKNIGALAWDSEDTNNNWADSDLANYLNSSYNINNDLIIAENWNVGKFGLGIAKAFYNAEKSEKWSGKVGLISASDYGYGVGGTERLSCLKEQLFYYSKENCKENDWLKQENDYIWTMTSDPKYSFYASAIDDSAHLTGYGLTNKYHVHPAVYLNEDVRITSGTGSETDPFRLEL